MSDNWFIIVVLIPVLAAVLKKELAVLMFAVSCYRNRQYDLDRESGTADPVQILAEGTARWRDATVKYKLHVLARKRGVYIEHADGGKEKLTYAKWKNLRTRFPPALPVPTWP